MFQKYERAEKFLNENLQAITKNAKIIPNWVSNTAFWYKKDTEKGKEFVLYDLEKDMNIELFNHKEVAKAVSEVLGFESSPYNLPFDTFSYFLEKHLMIFVIGFQSYMLNTENYECKAVTNPLAPYIPSMSPDQSKAVFTRDNNLWVQDLTEESPKQLTFDGEKNKAYGKLPGYGFVSVLLSKMRMQTPTIGVVWSPDSSKIIVKVLDEREYDTLPYVESVPVDGSLKPKLYEIKYPTSEKKEIIDYYCIDIESGKIVKIKTPESVGLFDDVSMKPFIWWKDNNSKAIVIGQTVNSDYFNVMELDLVKGDYKVILEEKAETFLNLNGLTYNNPNVRVIKDSSELIWYSERSGWGHLYRYNLQTGELINQITTGEWIVRDLLEVDEQNETIYFAAAGVDKDVDPYYRKIYKVKFDGSDLTALTSENADHIYTNTQPNFMGGGDTRFANISFDNKYLVDNYSTVQQVPVTVVRSTEDGSIIKVIEEADITDLKGIGFRMPERFVVKAEDGVNNIWGVIYKPSDFDPNKKYPVIDSIYNGPQIISTPVNFIDTMDVAGISPGGCQDNYAIAELGFIVIVLDSTGTPGRSKTFHEKIYGGFDNFGLDDHVRAIKTLAEDRPYMNIDKVGIFGHSFGGYASCRAILKYPNFFKVAVSSAGSHDYSAILPVAMSPYLRYMENQENIKAVSNKLLAQNLEGKLLLAYGEHDENVPFNQFTQLADELIKANKEFDVIFMPNENHQFYTSLYFRRRRMDYFVRHLLGQEPPRNYQLKLI